MENPALRVPPAVTRLTVYRRSYILSNTLNAPNLEIFFLNMHLLRTCPSGAWTANLLPLYLEMDPKAFRGHRVRQTNECGA